ncbi:hypothetical protein B0T26DRAFT_748262 [Lasiosphaeria miniovina]|uniref:Uncharacterized protein n=1 Tax=Lasiosphaeria miniovina TaxID=1954250 RepID=A0AA40B5C9_9PEZI|nr:uncharacterized protein B0T26DRAFT_748262 [Lasiosphaeria miniovina]KAK0727981.1 hypothetical protein B0T26DRAFT_748262 [Lasiosphaeria miniovina]
MDKGLPPRDPKGKLPARDSHTVIPGPSGDDQRPAFDRPTELRPNQSSIAYLDNVTRAIQFDIQQMDTNFSTALEDIIGEVQQSEELMVKQMAALSDINSPVAQAEQKPAAATPEAKPQAPSSTDVFQQPNYVPVNQNPQVTFTQRPLVDAPQHQTTQVQQSRHRSQARQYPTGQQFDAPYAPINPAPAQARRAPPGDPSDGSDSEPPRSYRSLSPRNLRGRTREPTTESVWDKIPKPTSTAYRIKREEVGIFNPEGDDINKVGMLTDGKNIVFSDIYAFELRVLSFLENPETFADAASQIAAFFQTLLGGSALLWWNSEITRRNEKP